MSTNAGPDTIGRRLRVLVVDDSPVQRGMLISLLGSDPALEVVGWAASGAESIRAAARLRPDVITMDFRMPEMDGLAAARRIMHESPTPIVMVTASSSPEDRGLAAEAFQAGILAIVAKPTFKASASAAPDRHVADDFLSTVKCMAQLKVFRRPAPERLPAGHAPGLSPPGPPTARRRTVRPEIVAVGASTGGPQVLHQILTRLPADFPTPVLVVQHIADGFVSSMVDWLRPQCRVPIELAGSGVTLDRPGVYLAPSGRHLVVRGRVLALTDDPLISGHRPSATVLMRSVAREYGAKAVGILLTGMGDDGAAGLREMRNAGAETIAQDEASSVVFGMPAVAIGLDAAEHVLPPVRIVDLLLQRIGDRRPDDAFLRSTFDEH